MVKVKDIMTKDIICLTSDSSAADAAKRMRDANVGTVLVIDGDELKGIVTDRAIVTKVVADQKDITKEPIRNFMTTDLIACMEDNDIMDVVKTFGEAKVRRMPVVNDREELVGVVSVADVAKEMKDAVSSLFDEVSKATR